MDSLNKIKKQNDNSNKRKFNEVNDFLGNTKKTKTDHVIDNLIGEFSKNYFEKYPFGTKGEGKLSLKKQNQHAQEAYMTGALPDIYNNEIFHIFNHDEIQGDVGTNAFLPPSKIEEVPNSLTICNFDGYEYYQPPIELANNIEKIYKHLGYLPSSYNIEVELGSESSPLPKNASPYVMTYGHGTTEIFDSILEQIIKNKRDVILLPTPCYGLFVPLMRKYCKIKDLPSSDDLLGVVNPAKLSSLINETENNNIEYFKIIVNEKISNLKNYSKLLTEACERLNELLGILNMNNVSSKDKLIKIDILTDQYNALLSRAKKDKVISIAHKQLWQLELMPRIRAIYMANPAMPTGKISTQTMINGIANVLIEHKHILIIEDVIHRGVTLDESKTMGSFTKSKVVDNTVVLDGISKIFGLPGARASFLIGPRLVLTPIANALHMKNCTYNGASLAFLKSIYALTPKEFEAHLIELNKGYQDRLKLFKAILYGIDIFKTNEKVIIQNNLSNLLKKEKYQKSDLDSIFSGIPGLKLYLEPEGGYFVLLDFSAYVGKYLGDVKLETGLDFRNVLYTLSDVNTIPDIMFYDCPSEGRAYVRYSLSIDKEIDMVEGLLRIKKILAQCQFEKIIENKPNAVIFTTLSDSTIKKAEIKISAQVIRTPKVTTRLKANDNSMNV